VTGIILRVLHGKGYGFIRDEDGHRRFFHVKDLKDGNIWLSLREGMYVEFEPKTRMPPSPQNNGLGVEKVVIL
jgi:cold shock CspA family protein